jgi:hypothetical protein
VLFVEIVYGDGEEDVIIMDHGDQLKYFIREKIKTEKKPVAKNPGKKKKN